MLVSGLAGPKGNWPTAPNSEREFIAVQDTRGTDCSAVYRTVLQCVMVGNDGVVFVCFALYELEVSRAGAVS